MIKCQGIIKIRQLEEKGGIIVKKISEILIGIVAIALTLLVAAGACYLTWWLFKMAYYNFTHL